MNNFGLQWNVDIYSIQLWWLLILKALNSEMKKILCCKLLLTYFISKGLIKKLYRNLISTWVGNRTINFQTIQHKNKNFQRNSCECHLNKSAFYHFYSDWKIKFFTLCIFQRASFLFFCSPEPFCSQKRNNGELQLDDNSASIGM